jgi:very-short-patch-repair endonuclease
MDKVCQQCKKNYDAKNAKQKYCSVECQHESYRKPKVERVRTICNYCGKEFLILPNKLERGFGKVCSKDCANKNLKILYIGENNPAYGVKKSDESKLQTSITFKKLWQTDDFRKKIKDGMSKFIENNGHYPGQDSKSKEKRNETMIERYGFKHNWNGKYGERKCDKTTIELYGKSTAQMLVDYSHVYGKKTDIETIFEKILEECNIPFQSKYRLYDENKINFWFREYDFLISNTKILIEVDGDYWHGNSNIFKNLSDFQKSVQENDKIKENFAKLKGYDVIRFWGSDVKNNNLDVKNKIKKIWEELN